MEITKQDKWFIVTKVINWDKLARIYDQEQRDTIKRLISQGFMPIRTVAGKGRCTRKHWNVEEFDTPRLGKGYRMISAYGRSTFNSITYFQQL